MASMMGGGTASFRGASPWTRWAMIFTGAAWLVIGALAAIPAMFSVMMFDAPGATENVATYVLAAAVMSFPIACFGAVALARPARLGGRMGRAWLCLALPLVNIVVGGAAAAWISLMQDGRFAG
jgi:hypothetical protein